LNQKIITDLKEIAGEIQKLKPGGIIIDIGANDGTLLEHLPPEFKKIGVEPAKNLQKELVKYADEVICDFWENVETERADVITAIGMFYDSENPNLFIENVRKHLKPDGVFIAQLMTLHPMIEQADLGNICHEHLEYYSYPALKYLYEKNGLEIFRVVENDINGGSYRIFARHYRDGSIKYGEPAPDFEEFANRIEVNKNDTLSFLFDCKKKGKKVYAYGASTKGNTILQYYGITRDLVKGVAEKSQEKYGKQTVGSRLLIHSEHIARSDADYMWVLPYAFIDGFYEREAKFRAKGGQLFVCTPEFKLYA